MSNMIECDNTMAFHPGYYIKDLMWYEGITQEELAKRLKITSEAVDDLLNGRIGVTEDMASKLSDIFGVSTGAWLNLNRRFYDALRKRTKG